jgi:CRAL/TRIO domain
VQKAAKRYARYWDKRVEVFGAARAFRPLTVESMQGGDGDMRPMEIGSMQIIRRPKTDPTADERDILYFDSGRLEPTQYTRESGVRAFWYFFHSLLEDEQVQKKGLICINYAGTLANRNRDPCFARMCVSSLTGCIPIRLSVFHGCHLPPIFRLAARFFMLLIGERMRKRVVAHYGQTQQVLAIMEQKYGIPRSVLPTDMGGDLEMDIMAWLQERRAAGL